jgi:hypothetical protein
LAQQPVSANESTPPGSQFFARELGIRAGEEMGLTWGKGVTLLVKPSKQRPIMKTIEPSEFLRPVRRRISSGWSAAVGVGTLALLLCSEFAFAQRAGTVVSWGAQVLPLVPPGTRFQAIAAGGSHSLALKSDGTVVGWGDNFYGQARPPSGLSNVVAVAAHWYQSLALVAVPPRLAAPRFLGRGEFEFTLYGEDGVRYVIESSTNLRVWRPLTNAMCVNGVATVRDSAGSAQRFYRAVLVP